MGDIKEARSPALVAWEIFELKAKLESVLDRQLAYHAIVVLVEVGLVEKGT